jgi:ribosomal protein L11 methyltransferase
MEFIKLNIYIGSGEIERLLSRLDDIGVSGAEIHDADDFNGFIASGIGNWDYIGAELDALRTQETHITLYLTTDTQGLAQLGAVREICMGLRTEQSTVREEDWADCWKEYFKPFGVGERLLVKPTWEAVPDTDRLILEIDPASAFGTGQHESTKLCLETLEQAIKPGCSFLDVGCGSGILTIAALLLGAGSAVMTDISENAVRVATENVMQNGFTVTALCGDVTADTKLITGKYDVIAANIVADVIIKLSGFFPRLLNQAGVFIASGIIEERLGEVTAALLSAGLRINETKTDNGWCLITGTAGNRL